MFPFPLWRWPFRISPNEESTFNNWSDVVSLRRFRVGWNQILSRPEIFSSAIEENWLLGTLMIVRSGVRMRVERRPMCMTVPVRSPKRQTSPTKTGRSPITEIPPNRFSIVFCAARATASPPTPSPARIVDVLYPQALRTLRIAKRKIKSLRTCLPSGSTE